MRLEELDYNLPRELIAQQPARPRDSSRLLVLRRETGEIEHRRFSDLAEYLHPYDIVVMNNSRVIPARLFATTESSAKPLEVLLLREEGDDTWECLVKPGKKAKDGLCLCFDQGLRGQILGRTETGSRRIRFSLDDDNCSECVTQKLARLGEPPLPPYITAPLRKASDYQTVYARRPGSVAAPTAGLHFTPRMLSALRRKVAAVRFLTLHIGPATFRPIHTDTIEEHPMPPEQFTVSAQTTAAINRAREKGGRVIAVGTSTCRVLETCADEAGQIHPRAGETSLFITPGFRFRATDVLLTNFHLPKSTNLLLVRAFAGPEKAAAAYSQAVSLRYRFFSFGDAMLVL